MRRDGGFERQNWEEMVALNAETEKEVVALNAETYEEMMGWL